MADKQTRRQRENERLYALGWRGAKGGKAGALSAFTRAKQSDRYMVGLERAAEAAGVDEAELRRADSAYSIAYATAHAHHWDKSYAAQEAIHNWLAEQGLVDADDDRWHDYVEGAQAS